MLHGVGVDSRAAVSGFVHGDMRRDSRLAQCGDMAARGVVLVCSRRDAVLFVLVPDRFERPERRFALCRSSRMRDRACNSEAVAVLHHRMGHVHGHVAESASLSGGFPV